MRKIALFLLMTLVLSCTKKPESNHLQTGQWLLEFVIDKDNPELTIPFQIEVQSPKLLYVINAEERIKVEEISYKQDSVFIKMPVFGSEFKGKFTENSISGNYLNYNKSKISPIPFKGTFNKTERFPVTDAHVIDFSGDWQVRFGNENSSGAAIGNFKQKENFITGTFKTETGDYRFLQGVVNGNKMQLSCFDGAHAFLFTAEQTDGKIKGMFYSGNSWKQEWWAEKTDNPELGDMKKLTFLKPGYDKLHFSFPNAEGETISLDDEKYLNKVVIVQIFGTWCPNCMDETRYLVELYKKYNPEGLEIIGLDFETRTDFDYFQKRIARFRKDLNVPYELLLAGPANKKQAAEALPMLNKIISYPTAIFIDRKGEVREIHTGFSGPGTGDDNEHYQKETESLVRSLLSE